MEHPTNRRAEMIFESTTERVADRIEKLAENFEEPLKVAFKDGCPPGILEFFILDDHFKILPAERHEAFMNTLILNDDVLTSECGKIVEETGSDAFIRIEARKKISE